MTVRRHPSPVAGRARERAVGVEVEVEVEAVKEATQETREGDVAPAVARRVEISLVSQA